MTDIPLPEALYACPCCNTTLPATSFFLHEGKWVCGWCIEAMHIPEGICLATELANRQALGPLRQVVEWVPVIERLPEDGASYPVAGNGIRGPFTSRAYLTGGQWFYESGEEWGAEFPITHWAEPLKHPAQLAEKGA